MKIFVRPWNSQSVNGGAYPHIVLVKDEWDDFGFKTAFSAYLYTTSQDVLELGMVKILQYDYVDGPTTTMLPQKMVKLTPDLCSLGDSLDYYEILNELDTSVRDDYLHSMNDVVSNAATLAMFSDRPGFDTSLLRSPSAASALKYASSILRPAIDAKQTLSFTYVTADQARLDLSFRDDSIIPCRMNAIIGYNGVGKTTVLAHMAQVAASGLADRDSPRIRKKFGHFEGGSPRFATTIAVSYSVFDSFELPPNRQHPRLWSNEDGEKMGYQYCGIRRDLNGRGSLADDFDSESSLDKKIELKNEAERLDDVERALSSIRSSSRRESLDAALEPLLGEPSFRRSGVDFDFHSSEWRPMMLKMSSGHQIALAIIVQLVAYMRIGSLALIDEPESHLHPPLLAALMKGISRALEETSSFAIVATHSPVVLQEIPKEFIKVLKRVGEIRRFVAPDRQTYGENLGLLTSEVFNLDNVEGSFEGVLAKLAQARTADEIDLLFENDISGQARALLMQLGVRF